VDVHHHKPALQVEFKILSLKRSTGGRMVAAGCTVALLSEH